MEIYDARDYKEFVRAWVLGRPRNGRGQYRLMAEHLGVGSVYISQVFKGSRELSPEQAFDLAAFLGLSELARKYFVLLVQRERAGHFRLKRHFEEQLTEIRERSRELKNRVTPEKRLSLEAQTIFYSSYLYSAIRLGTSVPKLQTVDALCAHFGISRTRCREIVDFLIQQGLCLEEKGRLRMGPRSTHLPSDSPLISRLHTHWRLRALEAMEERPEDSLFYTSPVSLAADDLPSFRKELVTMIERFSTRVKEAPCERLACLNLDWFAF